MIYRESRFLVILRFGSTPTLSHQQAAFLSQTPCISRVGLADGRGEGVECGAKSHDPKKAWIFINRSILSGIHVDLKIHLKKRGRSAELPVQATLPGWVQPEPTYRSQFGKLEEFIREVQSCKRSFMEVLSLIPITGASEIQDFHLRYCRGFVSWSN